ncbi:MAG TPA: conjugal transfer protein TrbL family protein [Nitrolancea sp.]|nr:conjugal transfer protein TrbL family protein [Nitrolancea sp.]
MSPRDARARTLLPAVRRSPWQHVLIAVLGRMGLLGIALGALGVGGAAPTVAATIAFRQPVAPREQPVAAIIVAAARTSSAAVLDQHLGVGLAGGASALQREVAVPLPPILPPSPIDPQLIKNLFLTMAGEALQEVNAALRAPLDAWLASPLNVVSQTPPAGSYASGVVTVLWRVVRGAANALLVVVVVGGGLNVMLKDRIGAPYHEAAELLPRAAVGALLANTSLWLAQLAIDLNNGLCGLIGGASLPGWQQAGQPLQGIASAVAGLLYLITALFLILQMLMRLALIDVLIVVAPLALLCWTLPQTQGWGRRWSAAYTSAVFTQFVQIVALKLGAELFTDLTPASSAGEALLPSLVGIALLVLTMRLPGLLGLRGGSGGSGVLRYIAYQQLRGR